MELGLGPQFTFPTATETVTGTGKWQAGVVALAVAPRKWGIAGVLVTWQHSFAGDNSRGTQNTLVRSRSAGKPQLPSLMAISASVMPNSCIGLKLSL